MADKHNRLNHRASLAAPCKDNAFQAKNGWTTTVLVLMLISGGCARNNPSANAVEAAIQQDRDAQPRGRLQSSGPNEDDFHATVEVFDPSTDTFHRIQSTGDGHATAQQSGLLKLKAHREDLLNAEERVAVDAILQKLRAGRSDDFTHDEKMAVELLKPQQWMPVD